MKKLMSIIILILGIGMISSCESKSKRTIKTIKILATGEKAFLNARDYDVGDTIIVYYLGSGELGQWELDIKWPEFKDLDTVISVTNSIGITSVTHYYKAVKLN
jgi:hypothetical protein